MFVSKVEQLSDLIESKLFLGPESRGGWKQIICNVCNDHSPRGGFFSDGIYTSYNCFNCGSKFKYEEGTGKFSRDARRILAAFGITEDELSSISNSIFFSRIESKEDKEITLEQLTRVKLFTPEVALPDRCYQLGYDGFEEFQEPIIQYLLDRNIDPLETKMHFSMDPSFLRRVIIPFYRKGKVIYWQARAIDPGVKPRYKNCYAAKDAIIYGYDQLTRWDTRPLFVTEGVFDAICVDGICILGSSLNKAKIEILKKTRRRIIFVIDRDKTGNLLAQEALEQGWEITFVDVRAADINDSFIKFGKEFTAYSLIKNATNKNDKAFKSELQLGLGMLEAKLRSNKWTT